jgi:intracellular sulfur oxidation DsrE/DsrF family protein
VNTIEEIGEINVHAFVDGQLDAQDYAAMVEAMSRDGELRARVCEMQRLKQLVRAAWPLPAPVSIPSQSRSRFRPAYALAASLLAALAGWQAYRGAQEGTDQASVAEVQAPLQQRILFHVATANPVAVDEMFNDLAFILESNRRARSPLLLEVIANADGLNLLRADTTRHAARIHELVNEYPNLRFFACRNTMDRLKREQAVVVRLIPEAAIIESGVAGVAKRQGEGWSYIRV